MTVTKSFRSIIILAVAVFALLGYNFLGAWTSPPGTPPTNNVAAPINVGETEQRKEGNIMANIFAAAIEMRADRYCDALGGNCVYIEDIGPDSPSGGGNEIVYPGTPITAFAPNQFRSPNKLEKSIDIAALGIPANAVRVLVATEAKNKATNQGWSDRDLIYTVVRPSASLIENYSYIYSSGSPDLSGSNNTTVTCPDGNCPGGSAPANTLNKLAQWISIDDGQIHLVGQCSSSCGNSNEASLTIKVLAYECSGSCGDGGTARSCQVRFAYDINGKTGTVTRTVYGDTEMGIGVWAHKDDYLTLPFTEQIATNNWGGSFFDAGEKAGVGYFDGPQYARRKTELTAQDAASNHYNISSLTLSPGQTRAISNQTVDDVPAGTADMTATVVSCTS